MTRRVDGNDPKRVPQGAQQGPGFAALQAEAGHIGKVSRKALHAQGTYKDLEGGYAGHMQKHQVKEGTAEGDASHLFPYRQ